MVSRLATRSDSRPQHAPSKFLRLGRTVYFQRFPQVLDALASSEVHLTGLFLLSGYLTEDNV